jgi:hypothetical protein
VRCSTDICLIVGEAQAEEGAAQRAKLMEPTKTRRRRRIKYDVGKEAPKVPHATA